MRALFPGFLLTMALATSLHAHHSISAVYDQAAPITIDGTVTQFRLVNPHPFILLDVTRSGRKESWKLELDNRFELTDVGVDANTFRAGDRLAVKGGPARDGSHVLYAARIDRAEDGFWYEQVGSSPKIRR
jgi:hypothetical protein